jgi:hypothetical protein
MRASARNVRNNLIELHLVVAGAAGAGPSSFFSRLNGDGALEAENS